jgi:hypothetical protein
MCRNQEQCVTIRDISFLRFLREEVELRSFEGTFRLLSPENAGKVSMKLHVSHPTDRIPYKSNRHNLLFNRQKVFKDTVLRKLFGPLGNNVARGSINPLNDCPHNLS